MKTGNPINRSDAVSHRKYPSYLGISTPPASQAWSTLDPLGTETGRPLTVTSTNSSFGCPSSFAGSAENSRREEHVQLSLRIPIEGISIPFELDDFPANRCNARRRCIWIYFDEKVTVRLNQQILMQVNLLAVLHRYSGKDAKIKDLDLVGAALFIQATSKEI